MRLHAGLKSTAIVAHCESQTTTIEREGPIYDTCCGMTANIAQSLVPVPSTGLQAMARPKGAK
jgi:hypothetical protein